MSLDEDIFCRLDGDEKLFRDEFSITTCTNYQTPSIIM
jgi:hypothetical protein